jgi:hypothetical protein
MVAVAGITHLFLVRSERNMLLALEHQNEGLVQQIAALKAKQQALRGTMHAESYSRYRTAALNSQTDTPVHTASRESTTTPDDTKSQANSESQSANTSVDATTGRSARTQRTELNPFESRKRSPKASVSKVSLPVVTVDGFTRAEIPDVLRQADAAAGRGDYRNARYEYGLVLRLDRQNAAAREGLERMTEARQYTRADLTDPH